jgi:hypothetical protein
MSEVVGEATTEGAGTAPAGAEQTKEAPLVPQADVDRIVRERVARERAKYADYDDLKAKAEGSKTLEERLASLESELTTAKATALRSDIAAKHGISAEDRDLFLIGTDEATLTAQAQRLAERVADRKKQGNYAPKEGTAPGSPEEPLRDFTRKLFNKE